MASATKIINALWEHLPSRQKEVLAGRFGLEKFPEPQTLAALGNKYGVTRERVRQIEALALRAVGEKINADAQAQEVIGKIKRYLRDSGGVASGEALLAHVQTFLEGATENHVNFLLEASRAFYRHPTDKNFWPFYYLDKENLKLASSFIHQWTGVLRGKKKETLGGNYEKQLEAFLKQFEIPETQAQSFLSISKKIGKNPYGDHGLTEWPEIDPRAVRDRIYLVLKKKNEPLHFRTIADLINKAGFNARPASAPTVHNELIKDQRFVLVGRGMYALAEGGYEPGTAREVIHRILKQRGPLKPREVMLAVQKERFFKPNTVLVNLQNKNFFRRMPDGTYKVREA